MRALIQATLVTALALTLTGCGVTESRTPEPIPPMPAAVALAEAPALPVAGEPESPPPAPPATTAAVTPTTVPVTTTTIQPPAPTTSTTQPPVVDRCAEALAASRYALPAGAGFKCGAALDVDVQTLANHPNAAGVACWKRIGLCWPGMWIAVDISHPTLAIDQAEVVAAVEHEVCHLLDYLAKGSTQEPPGCGR